MLVCDLALARRLEGALVADVAAFVGGMARLEPGGGARRIAVGGGWAAFTGAGLFANRVQGAGLGGTGTTTGATTGAAGPPTGSTELDRVTAFYATVGLPAEWELCPLADRSLWLALGERAHRLVSFRNVYAMVPDAEGAPSAGSSGGIEVRRVDQDDPVAADAWSSVILDGFGYGSVAARRRVTGWNRMMAGVTGGALFLAVVDGTTAGAANVLVHGDTASLGGTTTLPSFRRRGVQAALLQARLAHAAAVGCSLAVVTADPGSTSARNVERARFRLAYTNARLRAPDPI